MTIQEAKNVLPPDFSWVDVSDEGFRNALADIVERKSEVLLVLGQGGCGKSVLYEIAYHLNPTKTKALARTGRAAENLSSSSGIKASTVHSGLFIGAKEFYHEPYLPYSSLKKNPLEGVDTVLIDEVSMISSNLMDMIFWIRREAQKQNGSNIRLILFGDPLQLPPVVPDDVRTIWSKKYPDEWEKAYGNGIDFFSSSLFNEEEHNIVVLSRVMRQGDSQKALKGALDHIRVGAVTKSDADVFLKCVRTEEEFSSSLPDKVSYITLTGTNKEADSINRGRMKDYEDVMLTYHSGFALSGEEVDGELSDLLAKTYEKEFQSAFPQYFTLSNGHWTSNLQLYVGMQVMVTVNDRRNGICNGTIAKVEEIYGLSSDGPYDANARIKISYPGENKKERSCFVTPVRVGISKRFIKMDYDDPNWNDEFAYMMVLPLRPAYALTFHKAQGLTLDYVYIKSDTSFSSPGAMYVALSRCRTLEGIGMSSPLNLSTLNPSESALAFYKNIK